MLKSERGPLKRQKRTPRVNYSNELARPLWRVFYRTKSNGGGVFFKPAAKLERSFCTCEQQTKIKLFTVFVVSACVWMNYASELYVNYRRTMGELYGTNWIGEPHLYKEYKGLLGANYANRARLVSVGKLSRRTMGRAELSTKTKHNIKSFSKSGSNRTPEVTRANE